MKKIILLIATLALLVACGQEDQQPNQTQEPTDINVSQEAENQLTVTEITEEDETERDIIENDISLYAERDQSEVSLSDCDDFQDEGAKQNCKDQINLDLALENNDASLCENIVISDIKEICLSEITNS